MKKVFKQCMAMLLCALVVVGIVPLSAQKAEAAGVKNYCATVAAQWAKDHVYDYESLLWGTGYYDYGGDCANFVSQCLYMGGMDMNSIWSINGFKCRWSYAHDNDGTYAGSYIRAQQLHNYLVNQGATVIRNPSASQVEIGDVILYWNGYRFGHSAIVIDIVNGSPVVAAHSVYGNSQCYTSENWHLNFSGDNTYLHKLNGSKCVNNNPRSFDVYKVVSGANVYSSPSTSSSTVSKLLGGDWTHVYEVSNGFGRVFSRGTYGWVKLSSMNFIRHIDSPSVTHDWGDWKTVTVANCKQDGLRERYCKRCGKRDTDVTKGGHITDPKAWCETQGYCKICGVVTEEALGHNWDSGKTTTKPTCLEPGVKTFTCKRDSSHTYTAEIPPLGHDMNATVSMPNCTADGTSTNKCTRCSYTETTRTGKTWSDWTTEKKTIADPPEGYTYVQTKTQYRYRDKKYKESSSSSLSGWTQYDKKRTSWGTKQGPVYSDPSNGTRNVTSEQYVSSTTTHYKYYHRYGKGTNVGTGQTGGYVIGTDASLPNGSRHTIDLTYQLAQNGNGFQAQAYGNYSCPSCGSFGASIWYSDGTTTENHYSTRWYYQEPVYTYYYWQWGSWSDYSDTKYTSSDTRDVSTRTVYRYNLAALGHNFSKDVTNDFVVKDKLLTEAESKGTCYSNGKKCSRCGVISPDAVNVAHKFTKWTKLSATEQISYCDNGCGCYITKSTECTHDWVKKSVTQPTCTVDGYTTYKCSKCGLTRQDDIVEALGHENSEEWVITKPATCTESGEMVAKCVRHDDGKTCDKTYTAIIDPLGHTITKIDAVAMTCSADGNTEYYYCAGCNKYFADEFGNEEIKENSWVIKATGHKAGDWIVETENGCGKTGWERRFCVNDWCDVVEDCQDNASHGKHGFLMDEREIPEITPNYYVVRAENAVYDNAKGEWVATSCCADGVIYETCRNCEGTDQAHSWLIGAVEAPIPVDALNHSVELDKTVKASCVHEGYKEYSCHSCTTENCERCLNANYTDVIPAPKSEHQYILIETIETECSAGTPMEHYVCAICGQTDCDTCEENNMPHHYWTGDPANHDIVLDEDNSYKPSCTEPGLNHYICSKCEYCYDEVIEPEGHKMKLNNTIEASCLYEGFSVYKCEVCGFTEKRDTTEALGHLTTSPYTVTEKGTCISDGLEEQFCARVSNGVTCGEKLNEEIIPARAHNMGEWYEDPASTVNNPLCRKRDCQNTDETEKYKACDYTETENHLWSSWKYDGETEKSHTKVCQYNSKEVVTESCTFTSVVNIKATCTTDGERTYTCTVCGGQYKEVIKARRHNWSDWYVTTEPGLTSKGSERRDCTNTEATNEYEACNAYETREIDVTGANYQVIIYQMDTDGEYQVISDKTYCDVIGTLASAEYSVESGFTFNAGKSTTAGVITRDGKLVLTVYIDRNIHRVSFDDGTEYKSEDKYYDDDITKPADPEKEGYTFIGWSEDGETVIAVEPNVPDRDVDYKAVWELNEYTITYNYENGVEEEKYKYSEVINPYTPPEREGYTFTGWDPVVPGNMPAENLEFNAQYSINYYTITYKIDGENYKTETYAYNSETTHVVPESKTGYTFSGWSPVEPIYMPAEDIILEGKWVPNEGTKWAVEYYYMNLDGEYDLRETSERTGKTDDMGYVDVPTVEGFTLNSEKSILSGKIAPDGSLILKVYFDRNKHTISFDDGTNKTEDVLYYGDSIISPENPEKEGYTFKGWSEDGENVVYVADTVPDRDIEYKAVWEINNYTITYRYGAVNGDLVYSEDSYAYNADIVVPENPTCTGYTFITWDSEIPAKMPAKDITVTALWNVNEYSITYMLDGKEYFATPYENAVDTFDYGETITIRDNAVKEGYTVSEWEFTADISDGKMPAENIVANAVSTVNDYTVTFKYGEVNNNKVYKEIIDNYGSEIIVPENPEAEGYTFIGWDIEIPETIPAEDTVITALWNVNQYTITWKVDGQEDVVETYSYGDVIKAPSDPSVSGKVFEGWSSDIPSTMPAKDLVFYANLVPITHTATFIIGDKDGDFEYEGNKYTVVEVVTFEEGQTGISAPSIPEKDGYSGQWEDYELGTTDIVIKGKYEPKNPDNVGDIITDKEAKDNEDGTVTITLDAFSKASSITINESNEPLDIILVVDQSGSMADKFDGSKNSETKRDVLVSTAKDFVNSVKSNAEKANVDHRISIVGFAQGSTAYSSNPKEYYAYLNTEILTTKNDVPVEFTNKESQVYKDSLMSVTTDYDHITKAIDNIEAKGATDAATGFDMASRVISANNSGRKTIVVFLTDGVPTTGTNYESGVADSAVKKAQQLKNKGVTIYSIGISSDADENDLTKDFNKFLNAVSSNYPNATTANNRGEGSTANKYYFNVNDAESLSERFNTIYFRSVNKSVNFNSVTLYDTLTKDFVMTTIQEEEFRKSLKEEYGITDNDITIQRNSDSTYIEIRNLTPQKRYDETNTMIGWGVTVKFNVTPVGSAINAGEFTTNTENAGVEVGGYEAGSFIPQSVELQTNRNIIEYYIGDELYHIQIADTGDAIVTPDVGYVEWDLDGDTVVTERVAKYYATLGEADKKVTWVIDGEPFVEYYAIGQKIVAPNMDDGEKTFIGWTPSVQTHMGFFDLNYVAEFSSHTHSYEKRTYGCCTDGLKEVYTCACGKVFEKTLEPSNHHLVTTAYAIESETRTHFECEYCNYYYDKTLTFKANWDSYRKSSVFDLCLKDNVDDINIHKDENVDYYYVWIPISSLNSEVQNRINSNKAITIKHYLDDGTTDIANYKISDGFLIIECESFSYYEILLNLDDNSQDEITCSFDGHKYEQKFSAEYHWNECSVCGDIIDETAHNYSEWTVVTDPTDVKEGLKNHYCLDCDYNVDAAVPALGHTDDNKDGICDRCNEMISSDTNYTYQMDNIELYVPKSTKVAWRTIVKATFIAENVPEGCELVTYVGSNRYTAKPDESGKCVLEVDFGQIRTTARITVKVEKNGAIQLGTNGPVEKEFVLSAKNRFIDKLTAFFTFIFKGFKRPVVIISGK